MQQILHMNLLDYIILSVILFSMLFGLFRGAIHELLSLIIWITSFFIAKSSYHIILNYIVRGVHEVTNQINGVTPDFSSQFNHFIERDSMSAAMLVLIGIVFFMVMFLGGIFNSILLCRLIGSSCSGLGRLFGMGLGLLRGVFIVLLLLLPIYYMNNSDIHLELWQSSALLPHFKSLLQVITHYLSSQPVILTS